MSSVDAVAPDRQRALSRAVDVVALAGDEVVGDADAVAAPQQFLDEVGADETRAAGDE